jgi:membrane peptidoglycan carboxypeptidase
LIRADAVADPPIAVLDRSIRDNVPSTGGRFIGAALTVDTATGGVLAISTDAARSVADVIDHQRESGSTLKVIELAAAMQAGVIGADSMDGSINCALTTTQHDDEGERGTSGYETIDELTARSVNCAFGKL